MPRRKLSARLKSDKPRFGYFNADEAAMIDRAVTKARNERGEAYKSFSAWCHDVVMDSVKRILGEL